MVLAAGPISSPIFDLSTTIRSDWWRDAGLLKLNSFILCLLSAQMTTGYDESLVSNFQAMEPWLADMGHPGTHRLALITTVVFIGGFSGALPGGFISDRFGRRMTIFCGTILSMMGCVLQSAAPNSSVFMGGRFLIGMGVTFTCGSAPPLVAELCHPKQRGTILGFYNVLWYFGSIGAAWISFGTGHLQNSWSWRIPSIVQAGAPFWLACTIWFMPESPRFLLSKGREQEAHSILAKYHANGDLNNELVLAELDEIRMTLTEEQQVSQSGEGTFKHLFATPANRRRMMIVISVPLLTLWNGQSIISYYFVPVLKSIGITGTVRQTGVNGGLQVWNLICSIVGAFLAEKLGRRSLWLTSFIGMIIFQVPYIITSAVYSESHNPVAAHAVLAFIFLFNAAFNVGCNPLLYCYGTEILTFGMRAKGLSSHLVVSQTALIINQYVNPIAFAAIGWKYYIFFLGMQFLGLAWIYVMFPETKNHTLEELACLFEDPNGVKAGNVEDAADVIPISELIDKKE